MARFARIVIPGIPHHVTQRGNRRQEVFFSAVDYRRYLELLTDHAREAGTEIWAYCLMPNHAHLMLVPGDEDGLHRALQEAHRRYTRFVNLQHDWTGHLWQGRYASCPMDEAHTLMAARYVELNPVRAGLVERAEAWAWSSARGHPAGEDAGVRRAGAGVRRAGPKLPARTSWERKVPGAGQAVLGSSAAMAAHFDPAAAAARPAVCTPAASVSYCFRISARAAAVGSGGMCSSVSGPEHSELIEPVPYAKRRACSHVSPPRVRHCAEMPKP